MWPYHRKMTSVHDKADDLNAEFGWKNEIITYKKKLMIRYVKIEVRIFLTSLTWSKMSGISEILAQIPVGSFWLGYFIWAQSVRKTSETRKVSQVRDKTPRETPPLMLCLALYKLVGFRQLAYNYRHKDSSYLLNISAPHPVESSFHSS